MKIKEKLSKIVHEAITNYDFEEAIDNALDEIDIEDIINAKLEKKIEEIDLEPLLTSLIADYVDEELDELDIEDEVLTEIQDQFD